MNDKLASVHKALRAIHSKHSRKYRGNSGSDRMCCMWSTDDPPDVIEGTEPICDIEDAFDIEISDDEALELYDMNMDQAVQKILQMKSGRG